MNNKGGSSLCPSEPGEDNGNFWRIVKIEKGGKSW